jgi:hypothetical protein
MMEAAQIRERMDRNVRDDRADEVPICFLIGHMPDDETLAAFRQIVRSGDIEMVEPGFYRIKVFRRAETSDPVERGMENTPDRVSVR